MMRTISQDGEIIIKNQPGRENKHQFTIIRILGNELPPRDLRGSRIDVLRYQLQNEKRFENSTRWWFLNHLLDEDYRSKIISILQEFNEHFTENHFSFFRYSTCLRFSSRVRYSININRARNDAFRLSRKLAKFVFVLDSDCFLTQEAWEAVTRGILEDQRIASDRKYYSIPMQRVYWEKMDLNVNKDYFEEPQLVLREDAKLLFNEKIPFGSRDKVDLLIQLGHEAIPEKFHEIKEEKLCKSVGFIYHISSGSPEMELDRSLRFAKRKESLTSFCGLIEEKMKSSPHLFVRFLWKIRSWFRF